MLREILHQRLRKHLGGPRAQMPVVLPLEFAFRRGQAAVHPAGDPLGPLHERPGFPGPQQTGHQTGLELMPVNPVVQKF